MWFKLLEPHRLDAQPRLTGDSLEARWRLYAVNANRDRGFASD